MSVKTSSILSDQTTASFSTLTNCTVARMRSPALWKLPVSTQSTDSSLPICTGSQGAAYFLVLLEGRTTSLERLLSLLTSASANPRPRLSSSSQRIRGLNGSTAIVGNVATPAVTRTGSCLSQISTLQMKRYPT